MCRFRTLRGSDLVTACVSFAGPAQKHRSVGAKSRGFGGAGGGTPARRPGSRGGMRLKKGTSVSSLPPPSLGASTRPGGALDEEVDHLVDDMLESFEIANNRRTFMAR